MIASCQDFARRNKRKFIAGTAIVAGGYFAIQYVRSKLEEVQDKMSGDRSARENLRRRFEQNQQDCTFTVMALLPSIAGQILNHLKVEQVTAELQSKKGDKSLKSASSMVSETPDDTMSVRSFVSDTPNPNSELRTPKSKTELWNELKIMTLTRTITLIYSLGLLGLLTRVQLNIIGRSNYVSSVVSLVERGDETTIRLESSGTLDRAVDRDFLTFSWWLINRGWISILERVQGAVSDVFDSISPREGLSLSEMSEALAQVRAIVEGSTTSPNGQYSCVSTSYVNAEFLMALSPCTTPRRGVFRLE
ncbi:Peroxisomal biogenesis factor 3 [Neolecta irregularis DAH-3]|uniref:Peroxisomal biogenesis factor 3 n=1 Tax=Neolecta irregularis (strain DAH-3) TaxID=1198029 RepID=A0A1U7LMA6_NEOID|nr:Peroxisomal biogenesis factor 3 [Neolecta irregularis DAH-3]|eukprot:OLL23800.1 Peroxisomal biogenesis factor 3 [Neolecta irregularis DAH-3]